jgi:hypothetical protein
MSNIKHKVFISYHHANDQWYKNELLRLNKVFDIFIDASVDTGDIDDDLPDERIREIIRDEYLKDSTVTILLVGTETKRRKHIDWELFSSMYDGKVNKKSGVLIINLPSTNCTYYTASHSGEKERIYPENESWMSINERAEYERRYPYMPDRIIDNLLKSEAKVSVVNWDKISNDVEKLRYLIDQTFNDKAICVYDLSRPMRRRDS